MSEMVPPTQAKRRNVALELLDLASRRIRLEWFALEIVELENQGTM